MSAPTWMKERLHDLGWLRSRRPTLDQLRESLRSYQRFHALPETTGELDGPTKRSLQEPRFCGCPDVMEQRASVAKWPISKVTFAIGGRLPGLSDGDFKQAAVEGCNTINAACGIELTFSPNARTAHIVMGTGPIDRAGGTLAWSELPNGTVRRLAQKYDTMERWALFDGWRDNWTDLLRVLTHESCHACGLGHGPRGCLMAPMVSEIRDLREWDIRELVDRYPRKATPTPADPPPPAEPPVDRPPTNPPAADPQRTMILVTGRIDQIEIPGYRVSKLLTDVSAN